jgi:hypothetical protein
MKKLMVSVLAIIMLVVLSTPTNAEMGYNKLVIKNDEFTGEITKRMMVECSGFDVLALNVNNSQSSLTIVFVNDSWEYLRCNKIYFLIDGKRLAPKTIYDGSVGNGYVLEFIKICLNKEIEEILMGKGVKFKICNDVFEIPIEKLKLLKQIID